MRVRSCLERIGHVDPSSDAVGSIDVGVVGLPPPDPQEKLGTLGLLEHLVEHVMDQWFEVSGTNESGDHARILTGLRQGWKAGASVCTPLVIGVPGNAFGGVANT